MPAVEGEASPRPDRPEPLILTGEDLELLRLLRPETEVEQLLQADRDELACPACEQPLLGWVMIAPEYEGLTLCCPGCGWCEY